MNSPDNSLSMLRQESEEWWHQKLHEAHQRYQAATARYRGLLEKAPDGQVRGRDDPVALARREESATLAEYTRLLKSVSDLWGQGAKNETQCGTRTSGGRT